MKVKISVIILTILTLLFGCKVGQEKLLQTVELNEGWIFSERNKNEWLPAEVPGCVHTDLIANGKIEDPFYRLNELDLQWIDKLDWEYKTTFRIDKIFLKKDRIGLEFKGLDTFADIFINGQKVRSCQNMFRGYFLDVKSFLIEGENELKIIFLSPIQEGVKKWDEQGFLIPATNNDMAELGQVEDSKKVSVYVRKAGYHFGWDWGPRLVTSGIWRPVYLKAWDKGRIDNLQIIQKEVSENVAKFSAVLEIESEENKDATIQIKNKNEILAKASIELQKGTEEYSVDFEINDPNLWWCNGLGEQPLYDIKAHLQIGNQTTEISERIGIRTIELIREKDEKGTSFYFKLNGIPVFMKGANYIPNDIFPSRVTEGQYSKIIETAKKSNMNMLRVWGGGIYENDIFYDLCDEAGILVWQDFMFACAMYPGNEEFLDNVRKEAEDNVKRLRNHPSIALWCGNNEVLSGWLKWGWEKKWKERNQEHAEILWNAYDDIFHKILPEAIERFDSQRQYWSSSPSSGLGISADLVNGDEHYWGVWAKKEPIKNYETHIARFMSEYGFQSLPNFENIKQFTQEKDRDIHSEVMQSHQRSSVGNANIEYYMLKHYKKPKDFKSILYVSQLLQAEAMKIAIEAHRRAKPFCMGSLYWQMNDVWPVASWSSTDYYNKWKAAQYFVTKGFETVLVSPFIEKDTLKIDIVNDKLEDINGKLSLRLIDFNGKEIWSKLLNVTIPVNSEAQYFKIPKKDLIKDENSIDKVLVAELMDDEELRAKNHLFFNSAKDLTLNEANIKVEIQEDNNGLKVILESDKLAKNVYLISETTDVFFSDNYFDLLPEETKEIAVNATISKEKLAKSMIIQSLYDTY